MLERKACRRFYRELRDGISKEQVFIKSNRICRRVLDSIEYQTSDTILSYYPLGNEVYCIPVLANALKEGKRVLLPKIGEQYQMDFYEISDFDEVEEGTFHVMEPKTGCARFDAKENCEAYSSVLALIPGVVFDCNGNRYGYGKGYYDRYFARFPHIKRIALAYTEQLSETALECLDTDVKMHVILTDSERIDII